MAQLILAGAGTGKTTKIVGHISSLLEQGVDAQKILALTFTNEAAKNIASRVLEKTDKEVPVFTFHGFCSDQIEEKFTIIEEYDLALILLELGWEPYDAKWYAQTITRTKDLGVTRKDYEDLLKNYDDVDEQHLEKLRIELQTLYLKFDNARTKDYRDEARPIKDIINRANEKRRLQDFLLAWQKAEEVKAKRHYLDYGDLQLRLLEESKDFDFKHIIVDEFQDTNAIQFAILKKLCTHNNIVVVGDQNQSIYAFRGAKRDIIEHFKELYTPTISHLDRSWRSPNTVLRAAHEIIKHNYPQGDCFEVKNAQDREGTPVRVIKLNDAKAEAIFVANHIESTDTPLSETLILYRSHAQAKELIAELKRREIPFNTVSTKDLLLRDDIKKIIAYLQVIAKGSQHKQSWWVLLGDLNLDEDDLTALLKKDKKEDMEEHLRKTALKKQDELNTLLSRIDTSREEKDLLKLIEHVIDISGTGHHEEALINIKRFEDIAQHFVKIEHKGVHSFVKYLENLEKVGAPLKEQKLETQGAVKLLTMHAAKGLEAQDVYLIGWNDKFPNLRSFFEPFIPETIHPFYQDCADQKELLKRKKEIRLEEERRLAYVAITRAKKHLMITCPGSKSRFIEDLGLEVEEMDLVVPEHKHAAKPVKHTLPHFSFSNLLTYKTCPKRFELQEIYRMHPTFYHEAAARGSFFHGVVEKISKARLEGQDISVQEAIDQQNLKQESTYTYEDIKEWYEVWKRRNSLEHLQQVEKPFLFDEDGLKFTGFIDRIDNTPQGYTIIDYKTGRTRTAGEKLQWQLSLYAMSLIKNNKPVHRLVVDELSHEHPTSFVLKDDGTAIDEIGRHYAFNVKHVFNRMKELAKEIKKDEHFTPVEDDAPCRDCPFKLYCEKWAD